MKSSFFVADPKNVDMTLTMTMSLERWQELKGQLPNAAPGWWLADAIRIAVSSATKHFEGKFPPEEES